VVSYLASAALLLRVQNDVLTGAFVFCVHLRRLTEGCLLSSGIPDLNL
jgi:hypothetical protein